MKKVTLILGVALLALSACKKEYTCECTVDLGIFGTSTASTTIKDTKKKAEEACDGGDSSISECEIK